LKDEIVATDRKNARLRRKELKEEAMMDESGSASSTGSDTESEEDALMQGAGDDWAITRRGSGVSRRRASGSGARRESAVSQAMVDRMSRRRSSVVGSAMSYQTGYSQANSGLENRLEKPGTVPPFLRCELLLKVSDQDQDPGLQAQLLLKPGVADLQGLVDKLISDYKSLVFNMTRLVDHELCLPYTAPQFNDRAPEPFGLGLEVDIRSMLGVDEMYLTLADAASQAAQP